MSNWKTIDSAPRDGSYFLAFEPPTFIGLCWFGKDGGGKERFLTGVCKDVSSGAHMQMITSLDDITHWMVLPQPPETDND